MVVAGAHEAAVLSSVQMGVEMGLLEPVLIGDQAKIKTLAEQIGWALPDLEFIDAAGEAALARALVDRVSKPDIAGVIKGQIHTDVFMAALLDKSAGLRTGRRFTHHFHMSRSDADGPLFISDAALNILPDLKTKKVILQNAVALAQATGIVRPKVAILSATETASEHMLSSLDALALAEWAAGNIAEADVQGPLAFDNAISPVSAETKGITGPVAGRADTLIVPSIEAGNILFKALVYITGACPAGIVLGGRVPIVLNSRADDAQARLASMALSRIMSAAE
jgi:phosphotransacetylase